jgi:hypothetical protein
MSLSTRTAPALKRDSDGVLFHKVSHFSGEHKAAGDKTMVERSVVFP